METAGVRCSFDSCSGACRGHYRSTVVKEASFFALHPMAFPALDKGFELTRNSFSHRTWGLCTGCGFVWLLAAGYF